METHRWMTRKQAAERLGLQVCTLKQWAVQEKGPAFYRIGRAVRYDMADVEAYLAACRKEFVA